MTAHNYSGVEGDGAVGIDDHNDSDEDEYLTGPPRGGEGHHSLPPAATISPQDVAMGRMAARRRKKKLVALGIALVALVVVFAGYSYTRGPKSTPVATSDSDAAAAAASANNPSSSSPNGEGVRSPPSQDEGETAPETNQAGAGSYGDDEFVGDDGMAPYDDMAEEPMYDDMEVDDMAGEEPMYDDMAEEPMYDDMEEPIVYDDVTDEAPIYDDAYEDEAIYDDLVESVEGEGSGEGEEGGEEEYYGYDDQYADAEPEPTEPSEASKQPAEPESAEPQEDQEGEDSEAYGSSSQDQGGEDEHQGSEGGEGEGEGEGEDQEGGDEYIDQGQYEKFEKVEEEQLGATIPAILDENLVDVDLEEVPTDTPMLWVLSETGAEDIFGLCLGLTQASGFIFDDEEENMDKLEVIEEDEMNFLNVDTFTVEGLDRAKELDMAKSGLADVVVTPFLYPGSDLFDKDHRGQLMAIFRHPIEQLTRNYLDYVEDLEMEFEEQGQEYTDEDIMTIEDYVTSDETVDNFMVRSLTDNWEGDLTEDDLDLAKDIVERKILVGLAERMEETMERFEAYFRWQLKDIDEVDCQKEILEEDATIDAEYAEAYLEQGSDTWRILADMHALDLDLFEFVTVVWEEQVEFFR